MSLAQGYGNGRSIATSALPPEAACRIVPQKSLSKARSRGKQHEPNWPLARHGCSRFSLGGVAAAHAQTGYPDRPVKIIVPIGPGGSYDLVGRQLADALSKRMGQAFVVENKPGAGTVVGTQAASQSEPDGYTLVVGGLSNMAFNSALYSKLAYDPRKDFVPVALIYKFGYVMVGRKDLPHGKLQDIVAAAKANPGSISVATAGVGTGQHLVAAAFMKAAGVKFLEDALQGFAAGLHRSARRPHRPVFRFELPRGCLTCSRARQRALRCCRRSAARWRLTCRRCRKPACPASMSIPGSGYSRPPKTPPEVIAKLRREIRASLPELKERFEKSGGEVWDLPDDKLDAFVASEYESWTKLIREAGIKLD